MKGYPKFDNWLGDVPPEPPSGNVKTGGKVRYSHAKSYDQGRGNDVRPTRFPDDDEGGDWSESETAEAGMAYRKPL